MYPNKKWISTWMVIVVLGLIHAAGLSAQQRSKSNPGFQIPPQQWNFEFAAPETAQQNEARELLNAAIELYDQNRFAEAEKTLRNLIARFPKNSVADRADYYFIRTLMQLGRRDEALARINSFARNYPSSRWRTDIEELRISLTNRISPSAVTLLLPPEPPVPPSPASAPFPPAQPAPPATGRVPQPYTNVFIRSLQGQAVPNDPELSLQQEILRAVFRNSPDRGLEIASERLKQNPADPIVLSSLNMVAGAVSTQALPILVGIAKGSTNARARKDAIFWIGQSRANRDAVVDTLVELIPAIAEEDSDALTFALGQMRTDKAVHALAAIARDRNKSEKFRNDAIFWISQSRSGNTRVASLEEIYKNSMDNPKVRLQVLFALSEVRAPEAATLLGNIASTDPDMEVRKQAVTWLGRMRTPEAMQALENLLGRKQ